MDDQLSMRNSRGASLVEICVTILIISMTTLIIMSFMRSTTGMSKDARGSDAAYLSAEKKIVELSKLSFPTDGSDTDTLDNTVMQRSWIIRNNNHVTCAVVTVNYPTLKGTTRSITLAGAVN